MIFMKVHVIFLTYTFYLKYIFFPPTNTAFSLGLKITNYGREAMHSNKT